MFFISSARDRYFSFLALRPGIILGSRHDDAHQVNDLFLLLDKYRIAVGYVSICYNISVSVELVFVVFVYRRWLVLIVWCVVQFMSVYTVYVFPTARHNKSIKVYLRSYIYPSHDRGILPSHFTFCTLHSLSFV